MSSDPADHPADSILDASIEDMRRGLELAFLECTSLQARIGPLEQAVREKDGSIQTLETEARRNATKINELDIKLYNHQKEKELLKQETLALLSQCETEQRKSTRCEQQLAETKRMLTDSGEAYDGVCTELEAYQTGSRIGRKERELNSEISSLQAKLRHAEAKTVHVEAEVAGEKAAADKTKATNDKLVDSLRTEVYILKQEKIEIDDFLQQARDELAKEQRKSLRIPQAAEPSPDEALLKENMLKLAKENDELQRRKESLEKTLEQTRLELEAERTKDRPILLRETTKEATPPALSDEEWDQMRVENEGLKADLIGAYDDVEKLMLKHQETLAQQPKVEAVLQERNQAQQALKEVSQEAEKMETAALRLGKMVQQLKKERVKLEKLLRDRHQRALILEQAMENLQGEFEHQSRDGQAHVAHLERDNVKMKTDMYALIKANNLAQREIDGLRKDITIITGEKETLEGRWTGAQRSIEDLRAALVASAHTKNVQIDGSTQVGSPELPSAVTNDGAESPVVSPERISQEKVTTPLHVQPFDRASTAETKVFLVLVTLALTIALGLALFLSLLLHRERAKWLLANDMTRRMLWQSVHRPGWFWINELQRSVNPLRVGRWG